MRVEDGVMCPDTETTQALQHHAEQPWIRSMVQAGGQAVWGRKTNKNKLRRFLISPNFFQPMNFPFQIKNNWGKNILT